MFREVQLHQREWYCDACSIYFSQNTLFQEHMKAEHSNLVITEDFEAIMSRCERAIVTDTVCPLCGIKFNLQTLENHLGHHLQEVALFTFLDPVKGGSKSKSKKVGYSSGEHLSRKTSSGFGLSSNLLVEDQPISKSKKEKEVYSSGKHSSRKTGSGFGLYSKPLVEDQPIISPVSAKEIRCMGLHLQKVAPSALPNPVSKGKPAKVGYLTGEHLSRNASPEFKPDSKRLMENPLIISPVSKGKSAKVGYLKGEHLSRNASPKFKPERKWLMENPPIISPVSAKEIRCMMMISGQC